MDGGNIIHGGDIPSGFSLVLSKSFKEPAL